MGQILRKVYAIFQNEPGINRKYDQTKKTSKRIAGGSDGKESACNAGDLDLIPGLGRSSGEGNSNPLQYSCLENSMN